MDVKVKVDDFEFTSELPGMWQQIAIEVETDRILHEILETQKTLNKSNSNMTIQGLSENVRNLATFVAFFKQTVKEPLPTGFSLDKLLNGGRNEGMEFLIKYVSEVNKAEDSFRESSEQQSK